MITQADTTLLQMFADIADNNEILLRFICCLTYISKENFAGNFIYLFSHFFILISLNETKHVLSYLINKSQLLIHLSILFSIQRLEFELLSGTYWLYLSIWQENLNYF